MNRKRSAEAAHAADDAYAHKDDPDDGDLVEIEPSENLSVVVSVRLSPSDVAVIESGARRAGVKLNAFLRRSALVAARDSGTVSIEEVAGSIRQAEAQVVDLMAALRASIEAARAADVQPAGPPLAQDQAYGA